ASSAGASPPKHASPDPRPPRPCAPSRSIRSTPRYVSTWARPGAPPRPGAWSPLSWRYRMPVYSRSWRVLATVAALTTAACNENTGPQAHLSNPAQLSADLQTVGSVFTSPAFQSFSALGLATGSPVAATTRVGALLGATPIVPPRTSTQPYANAPARLQALRTAAGALRGGIT